MKQNKFSHQGVTYHWKLAFWKT